MDPEVSHELNEALDPLALYYQSGISDPKYSDDDRLDRLGWWSTERPDIDEVWAEAVLAKPSLKRSRPAQPIPKDSTVDGIIAGLLMFIRGELGNSKHPDFTSQADLTNFLSEKLGFAGTKTRTLAAHFSRANKLAKQSDT